MRKIIIIFLSATLAFSLTSCGAGSTASTRNTTRVTDGSESAITENNNDIKVRNLLIVSTPDGTGVLVGTIINSAPLADALLGLAVNGIISTFTGTTALPQNLPIYLEGESANAKAIIPALNASPGTHVKVTMFFANAGELSVLAIVRDQRDTYADITS